MDQQLRVFITVVDKKNFSKAAEELHMTQPAVSQHIRTFEDSFGMKLLDRTNKYVRMNKAGEIVYHHAKEIVGLYERMHNLVDDLTNKVSGPLSIGASYTFGEYVLPHIVARMQGMYPDIKPSMTIGNSVEIVNLVMDHQLDIGIVEGHFKEARELQTEVFAEDKMVVVASPDHHLSRKKGEVLLRDLAESTWILREAGSGTRAAAENFFERSEILPANSIHFSSTQSIKEAVEAGLGISLLSKLAIQKELRNRDLQELQVKGLPLSRQFSIVTRSPFQTKALQVFVELLRTNNKLTTSLL